jgi:hypothetical protein
MDMAGRSVTVRNPSMLGCLAVCLGIFPLIFAGAPVGTGVSRALWVLLVLACTAAVVTRVLRMGVVANREEVLVRNLGRTYYLRWETIQEITGGKNNNVTGAANSVAIRRVDGSTVVARGASSYSRAKVERWRDLLRSAGPSAT